MLFSKTKNNNNKHPKYIYILELLRFGKL